MPSKEKQQEFVEELEVLFEQSCSQEEVLLFMDAAHPLFNNLNGYKWQLKGKENTQLALSNEGRKRLTILSAYNPNTVSYTTIFTENTCDQEMICLFLQEIRKDYPDASKIKITKMNQSVILTN